MCRGAQKSAGPCTCRTLRATNTHSSLAVPLRPLGFTHTSSALVQAPARLLWRRPLTRTASEPVPHNWPPVGNNNLRRMNDQPGARCAACLSDVRSLSPNSPAERGAHRARRAGEGPEKRINHVGPPAAYRPSGGGERASETGPR